MELKTKIETNRLEIIQSIPEPQVIEMPDMRLYARANLVTQLDDQVNQQQQALNDIGKQLHQIQFDNIKADRAVRGEITRVESRMNSRATPTHQLSQNIRQDDHSTHLSQNKSSTLVHDPSA